MPIQINEENGSKICLVHVSGELVTADYKHVISEFERLVKQHGKLRVLFDMSDFRGWDAGALWQEVKFDMKHFKDVERCAAVGDLHWQQWLTDFCVIRTPVGINHLVLGVKNPTKKAEKTILAASLMAGEKELFPPPEDGPTAARPSSSTQR